MANKRIKRVIIAGAGFSAPAKLPIQSRIIDRMAEVPEMDFLTGKMPGAVKIYAQNCLQAPAE